MSKEIIIIHFAVGILLVANGIRGIVKIIKRKK